MAIRGLIDTNVLSLALRRKHEELSEFERHLVDTVRNMIHVREAGIIGPIRQELLSGVKLERQFSRMQAALNGLETIDLYPDDYDGAARLSNRMAVAGISVGATDVLIASVAISRAVPLITLDHDFAVFRSVGLKLLINLGMH